MDEGGLEGRADARPSVFTRESHRRTEPMDLRHPNEISNEERRREERPVWRRAALISVLLHALIFVYFPVQSILISSEAAAGPRAGDDRAASGSLQAMNMRVPPSVPVIPPPIPLPTLADIEPVEFDDEAVVEPAAISGEFPGLEEGLGLEDGQGEGDGGNSEEGLFREMPEPRGMIFPRAPEDGALRGKWVDIAVFVDATGRVVADSTRVRLPSRNGDYQRSLLRGASEWMFEPAMRGGQPVAAWFTWRFMVGG